MTCHVANCDICVTERDMECQNCGANYKLNRRGTCVEKECVVANCVTCVYGTEGSCSSCADGYTLSSGGSCAAASDNSGLSTITIAGVGAAVGGAALLAALLLLVFLCCCKKKRDTLSSMEVVTPLDTLDRVDTADSLGTVVPFQAVNPLDVRESANALNMKGIVRCLDPQDGLRDVDNSYKDEHADSAGDAGTQCELLVRSELSRTGRRSGRSARSGRNRSLHRSQGIFEDIDLSNMYDDNVEEILE
ncbi:hypothetical protein STCU_11300 [Strigomonas culicis]|uniref:EGF-like domain-containing protein n=1 Tax=Strigomonas culicis TaxID=28005 RepID=S9V0S2_9TRYP|nr:hypothetical protein STCU_11300 [Strigomonas culicis]|eukprot:EPY16410.1 hypothetical protein STCU_11300 [Strigomonas culicis]